MEIIDTCSVTVILIYLILKKCNILVHVYMEIEFVISFKLIFNYFPFVVLYLICSYSFTPLNKMGGHLVELILCGVYVFS